MVVAVKLSTLQQKVHVALVQDRGVSTIRSVNMNIFFASVPTPSLMCPVTSTGLCNDPTLLFYTIDRVFYIAVVLMGVATNPSRVNFGS